MKTVRKALYITAIICVLAVALMVSGCKNTPAPTTADTTTTTTGLSPDPQPPPGDTEQTAQGAAGYVAAQTTEVVYYDEAGIQLGTLTRGTQVEHRKTADGKTEIRLGEYIGVLQDGAYAARNVTDVIPAHTLYVRTAVNLRDKDGRILAPLADKGKPVEVTGCDYVYPDGKAHMYRVVSDGEEGYIMAWYLTDDAQSAAANYDNGSYATHAGRTDRFGGGGAADLDYYPREKGAIVGNEMPEECRTLYIAAWRVGDVDKYIEIANKSGINAFVVDIADGTSIGYAGDVMKQYCPSASSAANNTTYGYKAAIKKIKDAGYYVIGRITTFNDSYFIADHPEYAISDTQGAPLKLSGEYWPTPYNRTAWQYKVDLAVEAVELMGFNEIQFDYVRFPDSTSRYEKAGTIDFHNAYGETKAQAIQRFLMYATDILHEHGVYVSADVYGESAYNYVTAYGQYWPAISNVVDVISGMPYPDHFAASGTYLPWEHPYETLNNWATSVMYRQGETATPAAVRTWIQAYNAIREPYNTYGPDEVAAQISGLRDAGCTGGYMTWNAGASLDKYTSLIPAFKPPKKNG